MNIIPKKANKTVQINFRATEALADWVQRYADRCGTSKADLIAQLLENIKETQERALNDMHDTMKRIEENR